MGHKIDFSTDPVEVDGLPLGDASIQTGAVNKTMAASGADFASFAEFNTWLHATAFTDADITLTVSNGTYSGSLDGYTPITLNPSMGINSLTIVGESEAGTIIQLDQGTDYAWIEAHGIVLYIDTMTLQVVSGDPYFIEIYEWAKVFFNRVTTIDVYWLVYAQHNCWVYTNYLTINAPSGGFGQGAGVIEIDQASFVTMRRITCNGDTPGASDDALVYATHYSMVYCQLSNTINDMDMVAYLESGSRMYISSEPTLNNVTAFANFDRNQFQGNGEIITDGGMAKSGTGETVGFTAGVGTAVLDDSTFTGNVGATAYRVSDVVKALKQYGVLAE